jgi:hypothetical protein
MLLQLNEINNQIIHFLRTCCFYSRKLLYCQRSFYRMSCFIIQIHLCEPMRQYMYA